MASLSGPEASVAPSDAPDLRRELIAGGAIIVLFFVGFMGWMALAPLESAAIATGVVAVDGNRKTIQHLEGGIIGEILVREGEAVERDQALIRFGDTTPKATLELLRGRWLVARALEARLVAERDGLGEIVFGDALLARMDEPKVGKIIIGQVNIFDSRRDVLAGQASILGQRMAQYGEEITGIEGQIRAEDDQYELIRGEIADVQTLFNKGLATKPRLLQLQRRASEIEGSRNLHVAQIARARQSIAEVQMRVEELGKSRLNEAVEQLRKVQAEVYDLDERLRAASDVLARTEVRAPLAGTVVGLRVHTTGGVVSPGEPIMDIVPRDHRLIINARVNPQDIDVVRAGLPAQVRFTAFNQRHRAPSEATVTSVSADSLTDDKTGEIYYLARVELTAAAAKDAEELLPGMPSEVMIVTGARTALAYLMEPVVRSFNRAVRED